MIWYQLILNPSPDDDIEALSDWLSELGANAITLRDRADQPILEPLPGETPLWHETQLIALFDNANTMEITVRALNAHKPHISYSQENLEDRDWQRACMDDFKPMLFGDRLWICPSWLEPPEPQAVNLRLDPGLAFGTGTHPTTALCLTWLDAHLPAGKSVIDYGCGSGILAIAALKLGASEAWAVDIDEQALTATRANANNNDIECERLHVSMPENLNAPLVDLLVANILAKPLMHLSEHLLSLLKPGGTLLLSGILSEQVDDLTQHYAKHCDILELRQHDGWALVLAAKKNPVL